MQRLPKCCTGAPGSPGHAAQLAAEAALQALTPRCSEGRSGVPRRAMSASPPSATRCWCMASPIWTSRRCTALTVKPSGSSCVAQDAHLPVEARGAGPACLCWRRAACVLHRTQRVGLWCARGLTASGCCAPELGRSHCRCVYYTAHPLYPIFTKAICSVRARTSVSEARRRPNHKYIIIYTLHARRGWPSRASCRPGSTSPPSAPSGGAMSPRSTTSCSRASPKA
jgi:hypothetical protein